MDTIAPVLGQLQQCVGWVERKPLRNHTQKQAFRPFISLPSTEIQVKSNTPMRSLSVVHCTYSATEQLRKPALSGLRRHSRYRIVPTWLGRKPSSFAEARFPPTDVQRLLCFARAVLIGIGVRRIGTIHLVDFSFKLGTRIEFASE